MIFKNLPIGIKLAIMAVTFLALLAFTGYVGWQGIKAVQEDSKQLFELEAQVTTIKKVQIKQFILIADIAGFLLDPNIMRLTVQIDPQACTLGKIIKNPELMQHYEQLTPGFGEIMAKIIKPRDELHASFSRIQETLKKYDGNRSLAQAEMNEIYLTITTRKQQEMIEILQEVINLIEKQVAEKEEEIDIEIYETAREISAPNWRSNRKMKLAAWQKRLIIWLARLVQPCIISLQV